MTMDYLYSKKITNPLPRNHTKCHVPIIKLLNRRSFVPFAISDSRIGRRVGEFLIGVVVGNLNSKLAFIT